MSKTLATLQNNPVDTLLDQIAEAMESWAIEQRKHLAQNVHMCLNKSRDEILLKLLGFDKDSWAADTWKIDHCNGRAGNSPIGDFLKETQDAAIREWLSQIPLPKMSETFKKKITKELQCNYESECSRRLYSTARSKAEKDLKEVLDEVLKPTLLEKMGKTHALINPQN